MMFRDFKVYGNDPIEGVFARLAADTNPDKIDLGIGVYRDESGHVPVMKAVRLAEKAVIDKQLPKSYLSPLGNLDYCDAIERLVLGAEHPVLESGRIISAQTPGAGSALRVAAELVNDVAPDARAWFSQPVWFHQLQFFEKAGMQLETYRYYDQQNSVLLFDEMLEDLRKMNAGDLLVLHGCCHNPTGQDLELEHWQAVIDVVLETGAVPFVDVAYQGFGQGIEEDVGGLRLLAAQVPEALLTVSSSKSFGVYRDRAGLLSIITPPDAADTESIGRKLRDTARQLYFMAPDHAATVVHEILATPELEQVWRDELNALREHIVEKRRALRSTVEASNPDVSAHFFERQLGMFSCLPITDVEQRYLEDKYHIYMLPNARVNVAAMSTSQATTLAEAFRDVRTRREAAA